MHRDFYYQAASFFCPVFSLLRDSLRLHFIPLRILSFAFFQGRVFFLALHTLCFIVFWKSSFVVRCSTTAYFSSFFFGSGLSSVTGHTTFHKHIGPSKNSIIICINRKGGFRSGSHITPVVNLRKAKREWKVNQFFLY